MPRALPALQEPAVDPDDPTPHSTGALVAASAVVVPGSTLQVGLHLTFDPGWHTYWINPGDSGSEALLTWTLPAGFEAGPIRWPFPERLAYPPLMSFAYPDEVLLPVDVQIPDGLGPGDDVTLEVDAEWLVCEEVCLVAGDSYTLTLPVATAPRPDPVWSDAFAATERALPHAAPGWRVAARVDTAAGRLGIALTPPPAWGGSLANAWFFPESPTLVEHTAEQPRYRAQGSVWKTVPLSPYAATLPDRLEGIVVLAPGESLDGAAGRRSLAVDVPLRIGPLPAPEPVAATDGGAAGTSLAGALALALAGGLLLNLMPCVFPVLSLKILGFVEHAAGDRATLRRHGVAFATGVVASFLALAAGLLALRAAGQGVGWGFQLQDPRVVATLAFLMVAVALNFLGLLEVGNALTRLGAVGDDGGGVRGAFLTGVLATLVATPCTAPFMGTAVAAALVRPPVEGLTIFAGLGVGMALPYTVLSFRPGLLSRLPKPGRWMESLRQALAFPMLAVAVWLLWVLGLQAGLDVVARVLMALLAFALGAWLVHRWSAPQLRAGERNGAGGRLARTAGGATLVLALAAGVASAGAAPAALPASDGTPMAGRATDEAGAPLVTWEPFTPRVVAARRAEGRPVLVDFTAAWCISCQVNKRVALTAPRVEQAFVDADVALIRADWTRRDDVIADALDALGRNGVPVYALYPPDPSAPPRLLPNVLTPGIVVDALAGFTPSSTPSQEE
jgi:thiol:disulfide interchange protein DsbD